MTTDTIMREPPLREPQRARATFSTEDFALLRTAVVNYLKQPEVMDSPISSKYSALYHRLGRTG